MIFMLRTFCTSLFSATVMAATLVVTPFAAQAEGADIAVKMDQIPSGSWYRFDANGRELAIVMYGKKGAHYVVDTVGGADVKGPRLYRDLIDQHGNRMKRTYRNGRVTTHKPHNCRHVVGRCTFVARDVAADGQVSTRNMVRVTTPLRDGFKYELFVVNALGHELMEISGSIRERDAMGMPGVEKAKIAGKPGTRRFTKKAASWD